jgi:hypothetical protein
MELWNFSDFAPVEEDIDRSDGTRMDKSTTKRKRKDERKDAFYA